MSSFVTAKDHPAGSAPPPAMVLQLSTGHVAARCLQVVASMSIADHVSDHPRTTEAIAAAVKVNTDALHRVFRLLATHGFFRRDEKGWSHTPASALLRSDHPQSMRAFAAMMGDPMNWASMGLMESTLRTGEAAASQVHKGGVWGFYADHPDLARQFDAAMTGKSHGDIAALLPVLDMKGVNTVADIAGGRGHFLAAILDAHKQINGILFDQPSVIANAMEHPRMSKIGGDFFKSDMPVADLYLMTHILHDWSDADSIAILKNLRRAAPKGARLAVYELALVDDSQPHASKMLDIVMLTIVTGRERTAGEYAALFKASGWTPAGIVPTQGPMALNVAQAV